MAQRVIVLPPVLRADIAPVTGRMAGQGAIQVPAGDLLQYAGRGHQTADGKAPGYGCGVSYTVPPCSYVNDRKPLGVSTLKIILLVMVSLTSEPVWVPAALWRSSRSVRTTFTTRPLMIWGWSQSMRAVDEAGPADEPNLSDGQGQQGTLHAAVQGTACHHLGKAVGAPQLLFQLFFVELFSFEGGNVTGSGGNGHSGVPAGPTMGEWPPATRPGRSNW